GVATTRNVGIENARGEYIYFIDADDEIVDKTIEILIKWAVNEKPDLIVGNYYKQKNDVNTKNKQYKERKINRKETNKTRLKADMFLIKGRPLASACNKLYKKDFLDKNNIRFESKVFAEDRLFNLMCFVNKPDILLVDEYTYIYRLIEGTR